MRRRLVAALALLLVALPLAQAASPGARTPISADGNAVNAVAIAATAGRFAAGTQDPGSRVMGTPSEPTWHLWNVDGSLRSQGSADPVEGCPEPSFNPCQTDVRRVAVSADGRRVAVGATERQGGASHLFTFSDGGAMQAAVELGDATWNDLSMDSSGGTVAVALTVGTDEVSDPSDGLLRCFNGATGAQTCSRDNLESPAEAVAVSPSAGFVVAGAGSFVRFESGSLFEDANVQGDAVAVDASSHSNHWAVAGYDSGFFALYAKETGGASAAEYQKREAVDGSAIQAVAIRDGATAFATGNSAGRIRLYTFDPAQASDPAVTLAAERTGLGSVTALAFSLDGRYLAATTGGTVRLYSTIDGRLDEMWSDARAGLVPTALAIDGRGEHVVVGAGSSVVVYDAVHRLTPSLPTATQQPGTTRDYTLTLRNDGNRVESAALSASPPNGVNVSIDPPQVHVQPGASASAKVTVTLPVGWPAGALAIPLRQSLNGGADGAPTTNLAITVPTVHKVDLEVQGADSKGAGRGGPATFDVRATNSGNVREVFTLAVGGLPSGWTSQVVPSSLNLTPGQQADVKVTIQPPPGASDGSQAVGTLGGGFATGVDLTTTVGASFGVHVTAPIGVVVQPGVTGNITATVRNDGNAPDSFLMRLQALPAGWIGGFLDGQAEQQVDDLAPGETRPVLLSLRAASDSASDVPVQVVVVGSSIGDPTKTSTARVLVTVASSDPTSSSEGGGDGNGIPGPGPALLLALLALAAGAGRRRR